jgi:hypothetical protein
MYAAQEGIDVISIPHTSAQCGVVTNWFHLANGDPQSLPAPLRVVEVYQSLRQSFEYPDCPLESHVCTVGPENGWVNVALATGMRLGLMSSSDHTVQACYTGVYAAEASRDAIFDALYARRCFGTSRAVKMNVDFRVAGQLMGAEIATFPHPVISVMIDGSHPLSFIEINKDGNPSWFSTSCSTADTSFTFTDPDTAIAGTSSFYYLRVLDANNKAIWTSPVWVDFIDSPNPTGAPVIAQSGGELEIEAFPNPTSGNARFDLRGIAGPGGILRLHDVGGRLVRQMTIPPGAPSANVTWNGLDESGSRVSAGIYYAVVQSGGRTRSTSVVVMK